MSHSHYKKLGTPIKCKVVVCSSDARAGSEYCAKCLVSKQAWRHGYYIPSKMCLAPQCSSSCTYLHSEVARGIGIPNWSCQCGESNIPILETICMKCRLCRPPNTYVRGDDQIVRISKYGSDYGPPKPPPNSPPPLIPPSIEGAVINRFEPPLAPTDIHKSLMFTIKIPEISAKRKREREDESPVVSNKKRKKSVKFGDIVYVREIYAYDPPIEDKDDNEAPSLILTESQKGKSIITHN